MVRCPRHHLTPVSERLHKDPGVPRILGARNRIFLGTCPFGFMRLVGSLEYLRDTRVRIGLRHALAGPDLVVRRDELLRQPAWQVVREALGFLVLASGPGAGERPRGSGVR